jgi:ribosomal protein S18 acetylase RimI-like enzyme
VEVRRLRVGEGPAIRQLRLRALRDAPYAFSSSLAQEEQDAPGHWDGLAARSEAATDSVVFVAVAADAFVGMIGAYVSEGDPPAAGVWGMWVAPEARRGGVASRLLDAVAGWARATGAARLELSVSDRAAAASALYRLRGFLPTGETRPLPSDGSATEVFLARALSPVPSSPSARS